MRHGADYMSVVPVLQEWIVLAVTHTVELFSGPAPCIASAYGNGSVVGREAGAVVAFCCTFLQSVAQANPLAAVFCQTFFL